MSERKEIGKIKDVRTGFGGYDDAMIGFSFTLGSEGWGVGDFWGEWATERLDGARWTEADRIIALGNTLWRMRNLLSDAKVKTVEQLKGKPVEVTFEGSNRLQSWRILTEAI